MGFFFFSLFYTLPPVHSRVEAAAAHLQPSSCLQLSLPACPASSSSYAQGICSLTHTLAVGVRAFRAAAERDPFAGRRRNRQKNKERKFRKFLGDPARPRESGEGLRVPLLGDTQPRPPSSLWVCHLGVLAGLADGLPACVCTARLASAGCAGCATGGVCGRAGEMSLWLSGSLGRLGHRAHVRIRRVSCALVSMCVCVCVCVSQWSVVITARSHIQTH